MTCLKNLSFPKERLRKLSKRSLSSSRFWMYVTAFVCWLCSSVAWAKGDRSQVRW